MAKNDREGSDGNIRWEGKKVGRLKVEEAHYT